MKACQRSIGDWTVTAGELVDCVWAIGKAQAKITSVPPIKRFT
jgi:hypothetical protein